MLKPGEELCSISSLEEFIKSYKEKLSEKLKDPKKRLYFRGESRDYDENSLVPKVFRTNNGTPQYDEYEEYYKYLRKFPEEFVGLSNIEILSKMQHLGAPTRLLDLTTNPLVALFFACSLDSKDDKPNDGKLFVFVGEKDEGEKKGNILSFDSDRALMISTIPKLTTDEKRELEEYLKVILYKNSKCTKKQPLDNKYLKRHKNDAVRRFIYECERERTAFQNHRIDVDDLYQGLYVKTRFTNERIKNQSGLFRMSGFEEEKVENVRYFLIKAEAKAQILAELMFIAGIDNRYLLGGIEGLSQDNKEKLYKALIESLNETKSIKIEINCTIRK